MSDGFTIGGHEQAPAGSPYTRAIAAHIDDRMRWQNVSEHDRERLCLLYAVEHCRDSLLTYSIEYRIWSLAANGIDDARKVGDDVKRDLDELNRINFSAAATAKIMCQILADTAVDQCKAIVRRHYLDAYAERWQSEAVDEAEKWLDDRDRARSINEEAGL